MKRVLASKGKALIFDKRYMPLFIGQKITLHFAPNWFLTYIPGVEGLVCYVEICEF